MGVGGIAIGVALGVLIAVGAVVLVLALAGANDGLDCATKNADRASHGQPTRHCD